MTSKLIVGYSTRVIEDLDQMMPKFSAPSHWKDEKKIAEDIAGKKAEFMEDARNIPYTGTFNEVFLLDSKYKKVTKFAYDEGRHPGGPKSPVSLGVRNWILKAYPDAWSKDIGTLGHSSVMFLGFEIRRFLKILGLECSMPRIGKPLPPRMWYATSDHRDILEAILPNQECKRITLDVALKRRRPLGEADAKKWDERMKNWKEPGVDPETDVWLTLELATQLGFLGD